MPRVQKTLTLTIDDQAYVVEKMSQPIQQLVEMFDEWRQEEVDTQSKLLLIRAGLRDLQRELYNTVIAEREEAVKRAAAFQPVPVPTAANEAAPPSEE
jgi:hypothetical protein